MYDLIIIGAGPAGTAAGVYAARKQLKTLLITEEFGGQSVVSETIYNWIGTPEISGPALAKSFEDHLAYYEKSGFLTLRANERVTRVSKKEYHFIVEDTAGEVHETKTVLVASGSGRRKLAITGADEFEHKGITYCASCDGPIFKEKDVVVVGGGNAGFETAAQLLAYTKSVTLLHRGPAYKADQITVEKVLSHPKMTGILNANIKEVKGKGMVSSVIYTDTTTDTDKEIRAEGVFVEIGQIPHTGFVQEVVQLNEYKQIEIDPTSGRTTTPGIWAAGDCANVKYHQNNIAAGDGVRALEDIYLYIHASK